MEQEGQTRGPHETLGILRWFLRAPVADEADSNGHPVVVAAAARVRALWERDYTLVVVVNRDLCATYPPELLIPVGPVNAARAGMISATVDLEALFERCRLARARTRFPVPVFFLMDGRYLLRSATLSVKVE
jgi:hypothetical protein